MNSFCAPRCICIGANENERNCHIFFRCAHLLLSVVISTCCLSRCANESAYVRCCMLNPRNVVQTQLIAFHTADEHTKYIRCTKTYTSHCIYLTINVEIEGYLLVLSMQCRTIRPVPFTIIIFSVTSHSGPLAVQAEIQQLCYTV